MLPKIMLSQLLLGGGIFFLLVTLGNYVVTSLNYPSGHFETAENHVRRLANVLYPVPLTALLFLGSIAAKLIGW